ncbi:hypothetical protein [Novosphingobium gossypii]|uniref:hypothetical protein n=1 Tax=Novosphingobium gossypii TaxID=1604774 RepID=UPI003D230085
MTYLNLEYRELVAPWRTNTKGQPAIFEVDAIGFIFAVILLGVALVGALPVSPSTKRQP